MKSQTNLVRRKPSGIYYFRARVPLELVPVLGKTVIFDSLNTKDRQQATALASARRNEIQQALAQASKGGAGEAAYWLPLLALFTGARLEELAQLRVSDLASEEGLGLLPEYHG